MATEYKKALVLDKQKADNISLVLCEVFDKKKIDIGWAFKEEPPRFCGLIPEVLDYEENDKEVILKLRLPSMKAKRTDPSKLLGYSVIIAKIIGEEK